MYKMYCARSNPLTRIKVYANIRSVGAKDEFSLGVLTNTLIYDNIEKFPRREEIFVS
jgi:hypothetical protein